MDFLVYHIENTEEEPASERVFVVFVTNKEERSALDKEYYGMYEEEWFDQFRNRFPLTLELIEKFPVVFDRGDEPCDLKKHQNYKP